MDDLPNVTRIYDDLDDADIATPNCPQCLHPMAPERTGWVCTDCRVTVVIP